jgi:hypothetical protein
MRSRKFAFRVAGASLALGLAVAAPAARAHGSLPRDTPVDRLVKNIEARLEKSPDDADLHYVLGRLHALAFETGNENVPVWMRLGQSSDALGDDWQVVDSRYWVKQSMHAREGAKAPNDESRHVHLREALLHLNRAIELAPTIGSYRLALASILEAGEPMAGEIGVSPLCPVRDVGVVDPSSALAEQLEKYGTDAGARQSLLQRLRISGFGTRFGGYRDLIVTRFDAKRRDPSSTLSDFERQLLLEDWKEQITEQYFVAFSLALPRDASKETQPISGSGTHEQWIAHESATSFIRVVTARGKRPQDIVRLAVTNAALEAFVKLPGTRVITPIVFPLDRARPLVDLLDPSTTTSFDLDGSGTKQRWPWLARDTAILCWDPTRSGRITSGRQLFGSVSWWLFFANGYDALDALDDDRDGFLRGDELRGLAAWIDRDGDGVSDPGEVVPIEELGVAELSCRATGVVDESPCNRAGLRLASGAVLPTYDWVAHPSPEPSR